MDRMPSSFRARAADEQTTILPARDRCCAMPLTRGLVTSALLLMIWAPFAAMGQTNPLTVVPSDRITAKIDNRITVSLPGNVHPVARSGNDVGPVPPDYPMPHLVLVLKRDAVQQAALDALSLALQDRQSPLYHRWLRPEEFGAHFGLSQRDLDQIANWLVAGGFAIDDIPSEHGTIKFSGTVAQVEAAFHTPIHFYKTADGVHFANAADQQIPRALAGVVAGVAALHNFRPRPQATSRPRFVGGDGRHFMAPYDFYTIYNLIPLFRTGSTVRDRALPSRRAAQSICRWCPRFGTITSKLAKPLTS
jgi:hypothetical protein